MAGVAAVAPSQGVSSEFAFTGGTWDPNTHRYVSTPALPTSQFGNPATFTAAANTQASDYDTIMQSYKDLLAKTAANPITATPIAPTTAPYSQSADVTNSLANLSNLTSTGGYTPQGIADIRARDISPIRSIYANAQQNVERQKALAGGYSPNYDATQAQMARDESSQIADTTTAANAGIAQNVAANQLAAASPYAAASSTANAAQTQSGQFNANAANQVAETNQAANINAQFGNRNAATGTIQGMTSLYGTTPALTNTFGNQVMQANQSGQNQQQINLQQQKLPFQLAGSIS